MTSLQNRFLPSVNVAAERFRFGRRLQLPGESISSYITALPELVTTCEYGNLSDEMIRDQLLAKTNCERTTERLLMEPNLT